MADISKIKGTDNTEYNIKDAYIRKPDGTNNLIDNNKLNLKYFPDIILGQLIYGGVVTGAGVATLSTNAKTKLGTTSTSITLTNNTAATTGYKANEGIFYVASSSGSFASLGLKTGDWLISTGAAWAKVDNTDEVTSVNNKTGAVSLTYSDVGAAASSHSHGNILSGGTITSTAVTSATGVLVYDSNNKIQRATAASTRSIIGAAALTDANQTITMNTAILSTIKGNSSYNGITVISTEYYSKLQYLNAVSITFDYEGSPTAYIRAGDSDTSYSAEQVISADGWVQTSVTDIGNSRIGVDIEYYNDGGHIYAYYYDIASSTRTKEIDLLNLDAGDIVSGEFATARIPNLSATKITSGTLPDARLSFYWNSSTTYSRGALVYYSNNWWVLNADSNKGSTPGPLSLVWEWLISETSHQIYSALIPDLPAAKITSGTFGTARIPSLDASKITSGTFAAARIPSLDASKITSGTFDTARIPSLSADKISSGTFDAARMPTNTYWSGTAFKLNGQDIDGEVTFYGMILRQPATHTIEIKGTFIMRNEGALGEMFGFPATSLTSLVGITDSSKIEGDNNIAGVCNFQTVEDYGLRINTDNEYGGFVLTTNDKRIEFGRLYEIGGGAIGGWEWSSIGTTYPIRAEFILRYTD